MMNKVRDLMVGYIFRLRLPPVRQTVPAKKADSQQGKQQEQEDTSARKIGRNDPCPCGSGKKYKKCCGAKK